MKGFTSSTINVLATIVVATSSTLALPVELISRDSGDLPCTPYGKPGLLKLRNYENNQINGTVLAEGAFSVSTNEKGNENIKVQFEQCDFKGYNYEQGSSRNSGGSMGAPLEYFGIITQGTSGNYCLTSSSTDVSKSTSFRFAPCSTEDDDERLRQLFAYQIGVGGTDVAFVGAKNTTETPYNGGHFWTAGPKFSPAWPRLVEATDDYANYGLLLVSSD